MDTAPLLRCEILASRRSVASDLAAIIHVCAQDVGLPLRIQKCIGGISRKESSITLHTAVEVSDGGNRIWCLACRLACFCPRTRVSVLVHSKNAFATHEAPSPLHRSA